MLKKHFLIALPFCVSLPLLMSGCSNVPAPAKAAEPKQSQSQIEQAWQQRLAKFDRMKSWRLQGKTGIQHQDQSWTFNLSWLQRDGDNFEMNIKNPLTNGIVAYLASNNSGITLKSSDGQTFKDTDAEQLLKRQMGVGLPLKGMKYWARGIVSPDHPVQKSDLQLDNYGRPSVLKQAGWTVKYTRYPSTESNALPEKMTLLHDTEGTKIKVIAKDWQTRY